MKHLDGTGLRVGGRTQARRCWRRIGRAGGAGLCLRALQALAAFGKEDRARRMQRLLRRARSIAGWRGAGVSPFRRGCDRLLVEAMAFHEGLPPLASAGKRGARRRRKDRNLALRLHARRDATLRFLADPDAPFTDNEAERDLRMMKRRQQISGGFRSASGAEEFATLRTIIATAQKQGRDILDALTSPPERLITNIQYA